MGPGGPPGLQNRSLPADAGGLGSTPRRFRQLHRGASASADGGQEAIRIRQVREYCIGSRPPQLLLGERSGRDAHGTGAGSPGTLQVERRVPDDDGRTRRIHVDADAPGPLHGDGHEIVTPGRIVTVRAAGEVTPDSEMLQLDAGRTCDVAGQQRTGRAGCVLKPIEQPLDPGHEPFPGSGEEDLPLEVLAVAGQESGARDRVGPDAGTLERIVEDERIRPAGHRNAGERFRDAEQLLEGPIQGACPGAAGEKQGAVDVEEQETRQSSNRLTSDTESAAVARAVSSARNARKLVASEARAGIE